MFLFLSLNHLYIFLLFVYLGLISGTIYFLVSKVLFYLTKKVNLKEETLIRKIKELNKTTIKKEKLVKEKTNIKENRKFTKSAKIKQSREIKRKEKLSKISTNLKLLWIKNFKVIIYIILIATLILFVCITFYINFKYNYGYIRLGFVLVWFGSFLLAKCFINLVAKFIINFYNNYSRRKDNLERTI